MLSKYILTSNWTSLSANYLFDNNLSFKNDYIPVDGNIDLTYTPFLSSLRDYSNNNYSAFFLTNKLTLDDKFYKETPTLNTNNQACILANNLQEGGLVSVDSKFLYLDNNNFQFVDLTLLNENCFFELEFISTNELIIYTIRNNIKTFLVIDDVNLAIFSLSANINDDLDQSLKNKIKFNYIYDKALNNIVFYKIIQNDVYILSINGSTLSLSNKNFNNIIDSDIFYLIKTGDLPVSDYGINWVSYSRKIDKNNLDVNAFNSIYSLKNNYLLHTEYNNIRNSNLDTNIITLKNQLDINDNTQKSIETKRTYESIFTGGYREEGYNNISLNYKTNFYTLKLPSDKVTWFHLPYVTNKNEINIQSSNFFKNGAIAGSAPIYSDKIWKKAANYLKSSNNGTSERVEHSGKWLCAWLSGGNDSGVWVDRFYNPEVFTVYEAYKYKSNVDFTTQIDGKYEPGITDTPSNLTLEPGSWYAFSHIGKSTANSIISSFYNNTHSLGFNDFKTKNGATMPLIFDEDQEPKYYLNGNSYGVVEVKNILENNFTMSFFATRQDWNQESSYQVLGNYNNSGFGFFNNNKYNPILYYKNGKKLKLFNYKYEEILLIDLSIFLPNEDFEIVGLFRREIGNNIHIITSNYKLLEFTQDGTIVDNVPFTLQTGNNNLKILGVSNNTKEGIVLYENLNVLKFNLYSNSFSELSSTSPLIKTIRGQTEEPKYTPLIDTYGNIYIINGIAPILKGTGLFYKNTDHRSIINYDIALDTENVFLSAAEDIIHFNFNLNDETFLVFKHHIEEYSTIGKFSKRYDFELTDFYLANITFQDLTNSNYACTVQVVDNKNNNYFYNLNTQETKIIDKDFNMHSNVSLEDDSLKNNNFDISNSSFIQSIINTIFPLPLYNFKLNLSNQLDYEDVKILQSIILGEELNTGTHHFVITLDTYKGEFNIYIDGRLYKNINFEPNKYKFSSLFKNNIIVGSNAFYSGLLFDNFLKTNDVNSLTKDLVIEKFKIFAKAFNRDEVKLLYYQKFPPKDIIVDIETGERNYLDTITRTFKHKLQGNKSNLINLCINDSLITDASIQKIYEAKILAEVKKSIPAGIKINSIKWVNNKENDESMMDGYFNTRNTITEARI